MNIELIKRQSTIIDALRFPLIILILFMHVVPIQPNTIPLEWTSHSIYLFITEFIAHNFGRIAVPIFFLISGYLFFNKAPQQFEGQYFILQWKKRVSTLLIPYVLWNVLKYLMFGAKSYLQNKLGFGGIEDFNNFCSMGLYDILILCPDEPLWYVRDLIGMTIISPLFFLLFRYIKEWGLALLAIVYFSALDTGIPGFGITSIFYFGIGAYYALDKRVFLSDFTKLGYIPIILSLIILIIGTLSYNVEYTGKEYWLRPAILIGLIGLFQVMSIVIDKLPKVKEICLKQAGNVFFIYAVHELYFKNWINGAFARIDIPDTYADNIIGYFIQPFILLAICLILNFITKKYIPKVYAILTGGRV